MTSREPPRSLPPDVTQVEAFIEEHSLPDQLRDPLLVLVNSAIGRAETMLRPHADAGEATLELPSLGSEALETLPGEASDGLDLAALASFQGVRSLEPVTLGLLGRGGMGEVFRAQDPSLARTFAMKVLHESFKDDPKMRTRFLAEAQVTAQLAHPSIPPVHTVGELPRGLPYFTMKEVRGRTLSDVIQARHRRDADPEAWSEARLLDIFQKVCEAVAYAHARGVVHCDLKPANIMVGAFGEVMVMDWGVARLVEPGQTAALAEGRVRLGPDAPAPGTGSVAGTPAYMPPEQAQGETDLLGPPSDVYALGVVLFELLAGERPYSGNPMELFVKSSRGRIPALKLPAGTTVDEALETIVHKALAPSPDDRYPDAGALAADIARWREGSLQRERALTEVRQARAMLPDIGPKRERARLLRELAEQRLATLGPAASASAKASAWALEDEAQALEREASLAMVQVVQRLHSALAHAPDISEAHAQLADIHYERHFEAERRRAVDEAAREEVLLRAHDVGAYQGYLAGISRLTLTTDAPATARVYRLEPSARQLARVAGRELGTTPLHDVELAIGSYEVELEAPGRTPVIYPIQLGRTEPWSTVPPGGASVRPVHLPAADAIAADEAYVPEGWCWIGGDQRAIAAGRPRHVWVDGFAMRKRPVTFRELFAFLAQAGEVAEVARREILRSGLGLVHPDWPATGVSWDVARDFAAWQAKASGLPWRLPTEVEWEKAARGVDARAFPWGDVFDVAFAHARDGAVAPGIPRRVADVPHDRSPYGVQGLAGNVRDWCVDPYYPEGPASLHDRRAVAIPEREHASSRAVRGGSYRLPADAARTASRAGLVASAGYPDVGFRLVRSIG